MAILSNINDKFAVDSTGAIKFNGQVGTSGYILKSNGNAAPTWVDASTVIGGPYLPLTGGTLTGNLAISGSNSLTVGGVISAGGTISAVGASTLQRSSAGATTLIQFKNENGVDRAHIDFGGTNEELSFFAGAGGTATLTLDSSNNATFAGNVTTGASLISTNAIVDNITAKTTNGNLTFKTNGGSTIAQFANNLNATFAGQVHIDSKPNSGLAYNVLIDVGSGGDGTIGYQTVDQLATNIGASTSSNWVKSSNDIYNTNSGNVGIGTTSPGSKLHLESGNAHNKLSITSTALSGTGYDATIDLLGSSTNSECAINMGINGDADREAIKTYQSVMTFRTNNTERMRIDSSGNVAIQPGGATLTNTRLYVVSADNYDPSLYDGMGGIRIGSGGSSSAGDGNYTGGIGFAIASGTSGIAGVQKGADGDKQGLAFFTHPSDTGGDAAVEKMRLDADGNVGIGVTNPTSKLTLPQEEENGFKIEFTGGSYSSGISTVDQAGSGLYIGTNSYVNAGGVITYKDSALDSNGIYFDAWNGNDMEFYTALSGTPQKRMVIDGFGRVNVYTQMCVGGTTAPTNEKLLVQSGLGNGSEIWRFGTSGRYTFTGHKFFNSITGTATSDGWYTIGNVGDSSSVIINIMTAAHSQATILASRGYGPSNVARIQVLSSTKNANGGYANIKAVRINAGGLIDMQLYWNSGPIVSVNLAYYGLGCDMPTTLALSVGNTGVYPYNVIDSATFRNTAASARVAGELDIASQTHCGSNINMYSTSKIYFHATTNSGRYIGASSTNDLDIAADDDINYRSNFNRFFNGGTEFARLSGSGNSWIANGSDGKLGIGTTSPSVPLQVHGQQKWYTTNVDGNELRGFFNPGGSGDDAELSVYKADGATQGVVWRGTGNSYIRIDSTVLKFINFYYGISNVGQIVTGGTNVLYQSNSDYRLKENVTEMTGALDRVSQLKPSRYNFISHPETQVDGFMAHELQEVVPQAVSGQKDEMNEDETPKYQGVDHSQVVPLLVAAIQELEARVKELENR